jgi:hypothetical protein
MRKQFHSFRSWYFIAFVAGLIAVLVAPSAASARHRGADKGLTSAQAATKRVTNTSRLSDPDRDGLSSWTEEYKTRTNPRKFDTDGDGFGDGAEVLARTNPRSASSAPLGPPTPPPADTTAPTTTIGSGPSRALPARLLLPAPASALAPARAVRPSSARLTQPPGAAALLPSPTAASLSVHTLSR